MELNSLPHPHGAWPKGLSFIFQSQPIRLGAAVISHLLNRLQSDPLNYNWNVNGERDHHLQQ